MASHRRAAQQGRPLAPNTERFRVGLKLLQQGDRRNALQMFQDVLRKDPQHFGALCCLAQLHFERGAPAAALPFIEQALREQPKSAEAHHAHACILQQLGRSSEAINAYETAIALRPDFPEACSNLGGLYGERKLFQPARAMYEKALRSRPDFAEAHNNLGVVLLALDRPDIALKHFAKAIALKPNLADAQGNLGSALISVGHVAEASKAFEDAIRLSPRNGRYYLDLVGSRSVTSDDPRFADMAALAGNPDGLSTESRVELHFALGKAFADMGQFEQSFHHLRLGNALKRASIVYDEPATLAMMERVGALFSDELLRRRSGIGEPSSAPVFVVGMPRSGTTLIEQILASHPKVFGAGERHELHDAAVACAHEGHASADLFETLSLLPDGRLRRLGAEYLGAIGALAPNADRVVDKMPGNFLYLGLIALALPNARIIHVYRDPVDTCLSCFATLFSGQQPYAYDLAELGRYYRSYAALMRHWRAVLPRGFMLDVRYEDVVDDLEGQARRMIAHCGLDWDAQCLQFHRTQRSVRTASKAQVRQPLYRSAVGRSKAYGSMLAPLLQALGCEQLVEPNRP